MERNTSETSFDDAMGTLKPPAPSELLRRRVIAMAPAGSTNFTRTRMALAASLVLAVIGTAVLHGGGNNSPMLQPVYISEIEDTVDNLDLDLTVAQGNSDTLPLLNEDMGENEEFEINEVFAEGEEMTSQDFALLPIE